MRGPSRVLRQSCDSLRLRPEFAVPGNGPFRNQLQPNSLVASVAQGLLKPLPVFDRLRLPRAQQTKEGRWS